MKIEDDKVVTHGAATPGLIPALDLQSACEVTAHTLASIVGHQVTWHGDVYTVTRATILRDSHNWPYAVDMVLADDTRGDSIRAHVPVQASPIHDRSN